MACHNYLEWWELCGADVFGCGGRSDGTVGKEEGDEVQEGIW